MLDWLTGGDDADGDDSSEAPGDDLLGDADWDEGGEMEDDLDFDEMESDDESDVEELAHQVEEFEEEIGSMSSTINTIQHENDEIGEDLEELKDNVRKLLEIYEMVTRGVNPFSDDDSFQSGSGGGAFDLFGGEEDEVVAGGDVDDIDTDDMLDDDFEDDTFEEFEESNDSLEEPQSFDDLKEEYETGDADWEDGEEVNDDDEALDLEPDESDELEDDPDDLVDEDISEEEEDEPNPSRSDRNGAGGQSDVLGEKPYLNTIPDGYASDLLVMQWLSDLQDAGDSASVANTIEYYREIGWISDTVAEELHSFIPGLSGIDVTEDPLAISSLPYDDHRQSLWYIHQLATANPRRMIMTDAPGDIEDILSVDTSALDGAELPNRTARTDGGDSEVTNIDRIEMSEETKEDH